MELRPEVAEEGALWSERAEDWAEVQEKFLDPCYREILDRTRTGSGDRVLDIGCGAGRFLQLAAQRQAQVTGLDAAPGFLEIARSRIPGGSFHLGDMESLPFEDDLFDLVTGFNSFSHAQDPVKALGEAGRVARSGRPVAVTIWGPSEQGSMRAAISQTMHSLLGPGPGEEGEEHGHSVTAEDDLADLVRVAGLKPEDSGEVECPFFYPDEETMLRGLMSPGPFVDAARRAGRDRVREAILKGMEPFKADLGGYAFANKFRYLIATAPSVGPGSPVRRHISGREESI